MYDPIQTLQKNHQQKYLSCVIFVPHTDTTHFFVSSVQKILQVLQMEPSSSLLSLFDVSSFDNLAT